ncbi:uncharacterized protein METZ01_LOCUS496349, partial [marine metagenome]
VPEPKAQNLNFSSNADLPLEVFA